MLLSFRTYAVSLTASFLLLAACAISDHSDTHPASTPYLGAVTEFLDTMIAHGTDRYGAEHSPMFAALLDLESRRIPENPPPLLPGHRPNDRAWPGANVDQDRYTILTMYGVSEVTGDARYADAADAYLRYMTDVIAPQGNGLFPGGEHAFWNFFTDSLGRETHEHLGLWHPVLYEHFWRINPDATARHIRALRHHVVDDERWYWNRHAWIQTPKDPGVNSIPRHGGYYLHDWVWLYQRRPAPELLDWARRTMDVHWSLRHGDTGYIPYFVPVSAKFGGDHDKTQTTPGQTINLGLSLLEANRMLGDESIAEFEEIGRAYVDQFFEITALASKNIYNRVHLDGTPWDNEAYLVRLMEDPDNARTVAALRRQFAERTARSQGRTWYWSNPGGYGIGEAYNGGLVAMQAWRLLGEDRYREHAAEIWEGYAAEAIPDDAALWPRKCAGVIALSLDLHEATGEESYRDYARRVADIAIRELWHNGLIRAFKGAEHYEAANGPGELVYQLFRLHRSLAGVSSHLDRTYWNR